MAAYFGAIRVAFLLSGEEPIIGPFLSAAVAHVAMRENRRTRLEHALASAAPASAARTRLGAQMVGLRRAVTVAVTLATLGSGVMAVPTTAGAEPGRAAPRPKASLTVAPASVVPGEAVVLTGRSSPRIKRRLVVQQQQGKRWTSVAKGTTTKRGAFRVSVVPRIAATGKARLRVRLAPVPRRQARGLVTPVRSVTAMAQGATISLPPSTFVNKAVTVTGAFSPARPGRPVTLQQRSGADWVDVTTMAQDAAGAVSAQLGAAATGTFDYRLTAAGLAGAPAISSTAASLTVAPDPIVVTPKLEALTPAESAALSFDPATGLLTFGQDAPASVHDIAVGDFVAVPPRAQLDSGTLVKVTSVAALATGTVMTSTPAALPDVVKDVPAGAEEVAMTAVGAPVVTDVGDGVRVTVQPAPRAAAGLDGPSGLVSLDGPEVAADVAVELETTQGDASAKASLTGSVVVTPVVEVGLDVDWFEVKSYRVGAGLKVRDSLRVAAQMQFEKEWKKKLFEVSMVRGGFIGAVPVWVEINGSVHAEIDASGSVDASITWNRSGANVVGLRGDSSDGLRPHAYQQTSAASSRVAHARASGELHGEVYGKVSLELYSVVGPYVDLGYQGDASITGDTETGISCKVSHGPLARIGLSTPAMLEKMINKTVGTLEHSFDLPQTTVAECPSGTSTGRPVIVTTALPPAQIGAAYDARLATADDRPGSWRLASGQLPAGLALDPVTGVVSGTATGFEEKATFSVGFVDTAGTAAVEVALSIDVTDTPPDTGSSGPWLWTLPEMQKEGAAYPTQNNAYVLQRDYTLRTDVPGHYFHTTLVVPEGITLTIPPGTRIKVGHCYWTVHLPAGSCLNVQGTVNMGGDPSRPVIVTAYRDDSVGGDTDGVTPEQNYAGSAPMSVSEAGTLVARGVDLRWTGFTLTGTGASSFSDVKLRQSSVLQTSSSGPTTMTRVHQMAGAGAVQLYNGPHSATASRFDAESWRGLAMNGEARVSDSTVLGGGVYITGSDVGFERNTLGQTVRLEASSDGAGADFSGTRVSGGGRPRLYVDQGSVYRDVTWSPDVIHTLSGHVRVPPDVRVSLPPGSVVVGLAKVGYFGSSGGFIVEGGLVASGTSAAPVTMTNAADPSLELVDTSGYGYSWGGPMVWAGGSLELTHTRVEGLDQDTLFAPGSAVALRHVTWRSPTLLAVQSPDALVEDSVLDARDVVMTSGSLRRTTVVDTPLQVHSADVRLEDVEVRGAASALRASPSGAGTDWSSVRTTGGAVRAVLVSSGDTTGDVVWPSGIPFLLDGRVGVPADSSLTLAAGAVVKGQSTGGWSPQASAFVVDGAMSALGTGTAPVTLTHRSDPTGGDTPADSWMNGEVWQGIQLRGAGRLALAHTHVRGTQRFLSAPEPTAVVTLDHVDLREIREHNVQVESYGDLVVRDSTFVMPSERVAVVVNGSAQLDRNVFDRTGISSGATSLRLTGNAFVGLSGPRLQHYGESTIDAERNWWGHSGAPVVAASWTAGTDVVGPVDVDPWCLDETCSAVSAAP